MEMTLDRGAPYARALLRIMSALLFIHAGIMILFGYPAVPELPETPPLFSLNGIAGLLELVGGGLLLIGLFTRPIAFVLSGMMAVAYFMVHAPMSFFPALNQGTGAILYCFIFLCLVFSGPGAWSVDGLLRSRTALA